VSAEGAGQARRGVLFYMPNNDADLIAGDPLRMAKIRTATKVFRPRFFDENLPFLYTWSFQGDAGDAERAAAICSLAERLYQLGRGLDMAWAWGEVLDDDDRLEELLAAYPLDVFYPLAGGDQIVLQVPCPGSLKSVEHRYAEFAKRFRYDKQRRKVIFRQPPQPQFRFVPYSSSPAPVRGLYELRERGSHTPFSPWPLPRVSALVVRLRDAAVKRLKGALPARAADIDRVLVGRRPDGTNAGPKEQRVRIVPLPSIGHLHADREIRRVLIEVPSTCPLRADDVLWAFSGLEITNETTGEAAVLTRLEAEGFLRHYAIGDERGYRVWRTVTPAALPGVASRRLMAPPGRTRRPKKAKERVTEEQMAAYAVGQALRHANVKSGLEAIRVQREPFEGNGARVEPFAEGTRFPAHRLWHVKLVFRSPVAGPLVIGDGRFLGLGLMAPAIGIVPGVHVFAVMGGMLGTPDPLDVVRALRRAVMARVQAILESGETLGPFFTGHAEDGTPVRRAGSSHLWFAFDPESRNLLVLAPHIVERRAATPEELDCLRILDLALQQFRQLRAGNAGTLALVPVAVERLETSLLGPSRAWKTVTPYVVTRHARAGAAAEAVAADVRLECRRLGLPEPVVEARHVRGVAGTGLTADVTLRFDRPVSGPLLLGRTRYLGGGLFRPAEHAGQP
jgi:CRISPR-associated protein Csb2